MEKNLDSDKKIYITDEFLEIKTKNTPKEIYNITKSFIHKNNIQYAFFFPENFNKAVLQNRIFYVENENCWKIRLSQIYQLENFLFIDDMNCDIDLVFSDETTNLIGAVMNSTVQIPIEKEEFLIQNNELVKSMFKSNNGIPTDYFGWYNIFKYHSCEFEVIGIQIHEIQNLIEYKLNFSRDFVHRSNNHYFYKLGEFMKTDTYISIQLAIDGTVLGSYPCMLINPPNLKKFKIFISFEYGQYPIWLLTNEKIVFFDASFFNLLSDGLKLELNRFQDEYNSLFENKESGFVYHGFMESSKETEFYASVYDLSIQLEKELNGKYEIELDENIKKHLHQ